MFPSYGLVAAKVRQDRRYCPNSAALARSVHDFCQLVALIEQEH
jgi:hypothetical protein